MLINKSKDHALLYTTSLTNFTISSASKDHGTSSKTQYETGGITNTSDDSQDYASVMPYEQPMQTEANLCYTTIGQKHA